MKRLFLFGLFALLALTGQAQNTDVAPDQTGMTLNAQDWTREVVMGWNLGNSLECPKTETEWGNPRTTQAMIKAVRQAGFNAIRIPVRWINHVTSAQTMQVDATWMARVKEVVGWCLDEDMYVVLNTHHEEWLEVNPSNSTKTANNQKLSLLWKNIATAFRDYDQRLIFAGTNEVRRSDWGAPTAEQQAVQNSFNQTFIDAVRATGGKNYYRNLVVQTFACSPYHGLNAFAIPSDKVEGRLSVEFHYYDPYEYCGSCQYYYWGNAYKDKGTILTSSTETTMTNLFDRIRNTWGGKGLGVVIGEYGVANHYTENDKQTQQENMQYYLTCLVGEARQHGFAAFAWDNNAFGNGSENFGIFNRWQNMSVGNTFFLKGITEGAGQQYVEPTTPSDPENFGQEGKTFWEGDEKMDWGSGLQLTIPAAEFQPLSSKMRLLLSYTQDYTDYDDLQIFYGDWSKLVSFQVDGQEFNGDFAPSGYYFTPTGTTHTTPVGFSDDVFQTVRQKGLVIQGHGLRLTKVALFEPSEDGLSLPTLCPAGPQVVYTLGGMRVSRPQPGHLYIANGRKFVAR